MTHRTEWYADVTPGLQDAVVRRYEERARSLMDRAMRTGPAEQRERFWREQVLRDPVLKALVK